MGQIADDMVNGRCCDLCGQYYENKKKPNTMYEHGHPATCKDCWEELTLLERKLHKQAKTDTL